MFDNPRDSFGIAQKILNYSFNSTDEREWQEAAMLLKEQKPLVQAYVMDQIFDKMANGDAWLAPYYAGDAATLVADNPNIGFSIPTKEGTNFFVDALCIPKGAAHKKEAEEYINFLCCLLYTSLLTHNLWFEKGVHVLCGIAATVYYFSRVSQISLIRRVCRL